jgi:hypothetical protein
MTRSGYTRLVRLSCLLAAGSAAAPFKVAVLRAPDEQIFENFGVSVAGASDVDGDGYADQTVGAWVEDPDQSPLDAGRAYVFLATDQR